MYLERAPEESIDSYAGPYERWTFSQELGRPFAFPAIAGESSGYYTALLEGAQLPPDDAGLTTRVPPIWNPTGQTRSVTPFAFAEAPDTGAALESGSAAPLPDAKLTTLLKTVKSGTYRQRASVSPRFRINFPITAAAWTGAYMEGEAPADWAPPPAKPKVIIGVIDDALPFAHRAFLDSAGKTRVSHCWLQSGKAEAQACVPFGREIVNAEIDAWRSAVGPDDAEIYRRAGAIDPAEPELGQSLRRHATHGSLVMGIAAGNDPLFEAAALDDEVLIIAVQLPNTIAWDTSGFGKEMYMLSALHYIFERASRIAAHFGEVELPLVTNFSYGWSASRHDGESEMELAIGEMLESRRSLQPQSYLCMPTGNNFSSKLHARIAEPDFEGSAARAEIGWQILPDDRTSSYLEMWFPKEFDPEGYRVTITPPPGAGLDGPVTIEVSPDPQFDTPADGDPRRFVEIEKNGQNIGQMSADMHRGDRWRVMIALIPTVFTRGEDRVAPVGLWRIAVTRGAGAEALGSDEALDIWLQRDDDPADLKTQGRQSRLVSFQTRAQAQDPLKRYLPDLPQVRGYGAMNAVASSPATTRIAGYVQSDGQPCFYSGSGGLSEAADGTITSWGQQADITAVADLSVTRPGVPSIGVLSGARGRIVGTSGASPTAARMIARNLAEGRDAMHGFTAPLGPRPCETPSPSTDRQHEARTGALAVPGVIKSG